jgi:hypothetical protein
VIGSRLPETGRHRVAAGRPNAVIGRLLAVALGFAVAVSVAIVIVVGVSAVSTGSGFANPAGAAALSSPNGRIT